MILETPRLILREMTQTDYPALAEILQDREAMFAYEHAFSDVETQAWLNRILERYRTDGYGLWAVVRNETSEMIGQCGLTRQRVEEREVLEDLLIAAHADAKQKVEATMASEMQKATAGINLPPGMKLPF